MKQTVYIEMAGTANATGAVTLESNPLRAGEILCVQHVAIKNESGDGAVAHLKVKYSKSTYSVKTVVLTTAGYIYSHENPIFIGSDGVLQVVVSGASSGSKVSVDVFGYITEAN